MLFISYYNYSFTAFVSLNI